MKPHPLKAVVAAAVVSILACITQVSAAPSSAPIQITSLDTRREGNLAIAQGGVVIAVGENTIYCDYAQYDTESKNVLVSGNVRIFRNGAVFTGDRAIYNLQSKSFMGSAFRSSAGPFMAEAHSFSSAEKGVFTASKGFITTDNVADPSFSLRAKTVRFLPNDHAEYEDVTLYVGHVPVFWLPYLYQPANKDQSFSLEPGSRGIWGAFLLTRFSMPLGETVLGSARLDYMSKRGLGLGLDADWPHVQGQAAAKPTEVPSWGRFRTYYITDQDPGINPVSKTKDPIQPNRYRLSVQDRAYLSDTVYTSININKLSDVSFLRDFSPKDMREDPNPDTLLALTKWDEDYTLTLAARLRLNNQYEGSGTIPSLSLDLKRQPFLDSKVFYEGETSVGKFQRHFGKEAGLTNFDTVREDTFHQWSYPFVANGWLSLVPKVGVRGTHYRQSVFDTHVKEGDLLYAKGGSLTRLSMNAGLEASFKVSRVYDSVESRTWGLDGLRHILQPFTEWSWVQSNQDASKILQFDRLRPSTQLPAVDPSHFNAVDSLSDWHVVRLGLRNRLQTRRDDETLNWLELESFVDANLQKPGFASLLPYSQGSYSNVFNNLHWQPLPWVKLNLDSQAPLLDNGFTEVGAHADVQVTRDLAVQLGNRHLSGHPSFTNSNLVSAGARVRLNDNWAFSFLSSYDFATRIAESQQYSIDRDLRSWAASLSLVIRELDSKKDVAVMLSLSLKDIPKMGLPLKYDTAAIDSTGSGKNR